MSFDIWAVRANDGYINTELHRFAALVAAAEREACAQLCDMIADPPVGSGYDDVFEGGVEAGADRCADAIRARGET